MRNLSSMLSGWLRSAVLPCSVFGIIALAFIPNLAQAQSIGFASGQNTNWASLNNALRVQISGDAGGAVANSIKVTFTGTSGAASSTTVVVAISGSSQDNILTVPIRNLSGITGVSGQTAYFVNPTTSNSLPDGGYNIRASYQRVNGGTTITSSILAITLNTSNFLPSFTDPSPSTTYTSTVPIAYDLNEAYAAGSAKITFSNSGGTANIVTLTDSNLSATSFDLNPLSVLLSSSNISSVSASTIPDGTYTVTLSYNTAVGAVPMSTSKTLVRIDLNAPTLSLTSPVPTRTADSTPNISFSSSEAGTITFGGSCSSVTTSATSGANTITLAADGAGSALGDGTYSDCTIQVTDSASHVSTALSLGTFTVDTTAPSLSEVTVVPAISSTNTPSVTFNTDEAGTISYGGACTGLTTVATSGNNSIVLRGSSLGYGLPDGTYSNCTLQVTDDVGNISSALSLSTFVVDTTAPAAVSIASYSNPTTDNTPTISYTLAQAGLTVHFSSNLEGGVGSDTSVSGVNSTTLATLQDGTHIITVTTTDSANNSTSITFGLTVDTTNPVITLSGSPALSIEQGSTFTDAGATATDLIAGDLTSRIHTVNSVNSLIPGIYHVTYQVTDNAGNSDTKTRTVTVNVPPTPTSVPTSTATATDTPTEIPLPTETQAPSATAITPEPTQTPQPTPSPTIVPPALSTSIEGRVVDANGNGLADIVLYLYRAGAGSTSIDNVTLKAEGETGVQSTKTAADGTYIFNNLLPGTYRISPSSTAQSFEPRALAVNAGEGTQTFLASSQDLHDEGCSRKSRLKEILNADAKSKELNLFLKKQVTAAKNKAEKKLKQPQFIKFSGALDGLVIKADFEFTQLLNYSEALPKLTLSCPKKLGCTLLKYQTETKAYRKHIRNLRGWNLRVAKQVYSTLNGRKEKSTDPQIQVIERKFVSASIAAQRLPTVTNQCS